MSSCPILLLNSELPVTLSDGPAVITQPQKDPELKSLWR